MRAVLAVTRVQLKIIANDPWLCAGHAPDIFIAAPIFRGGRLVGIVCNSAHHIDLGGLHPELMSELLGGLDVAIGKNKARKPPSSDELARGL